MRFVIFLLVFYLVYFLVRTLFIKPFKQGFSQGRNSGGHSNQSRSAREGDVTISYNPNKDKKESKQTGDYIDYEEVKD